MNRKEAAIAITNEFISEFNETTPVSFNNQNNFWLCTSPLTATVKPSDSNWLKFEVVDNDTPKVTLGTKGHRRYRRSGFIACQVFINEGSGTSDGRDLCEEIINIFEGERIAEYIVFNEGNYIPIGNLDSGWFQFNVVIYFTFDESK